MFLLFLLFTSLFISLAFCSSCCLQACSSAWRFCSSCCLRACSSAWRFCSSCCLRACSSAWRFCSSCCLRACSSAWRFVPLVVYEFVHQQDVLFFLLFTSLFISLAFFILLLTSLFLGLTLLIFLLLSFFVCFLFSSSFCRYLLFCSVRSNFLLVAVVFQK